LFIYLASSIQEGGEVNSFDPFTILDIPAGSDIKSIKKAYKKMSLKWHPDKNPNNPSAEAKFMMVAKAYESLTDPVAKENYEKYGNPGKFFERFPVSHSFVSVTLKYVSNFHLDIL